MLLELSKERRSARPEVGQQKISGTRVCFHGESLQLRSEPGAHALHFADIRSHRCAVLHSGFSGNERRKVHRKGRHGAPHQGERLFAGDDRAEPQGGKPGDF